MSNAHKGIDLENNDESKSGLDDEGIANFLTDALGNEVENEVLQDFGNTDTIEELMEVVTSSFPNMETDLLSNSYDYNLGNFDNANNKSGRGPTVTQDTTSATNSNIVKVPKRKYNRKSGALNKTREAPLKNTRNQNSSNEDYLKHTICFKRNCEYSNMLHRFNIKPSCLMLFDIFDLKTLHEARMKSHKATRNACCEFPCRIVLATRRLNCIRKLEVTNRNRVLANVNMHMHTMKKEHTRKSPKRFNSGSSKNLLKPGSLQKKINEVTKCLDNAQNNSRIPKSSPKDKKKVRAVANLSNLTPCFNNNSIKRKKCNLSNGLSDCEFLQLPECHEVQTSSKIDKAGLKCKSLFETKSINLKKTEEMSTKEEHLNACMKYKPPENFVNPVPPDAYPYYSKNGSCAKNEKGSFASEPLIKSEVPHVLKMMKLDKTLNTSFRIPKKSSQAIETKHAVDNFKFVPVSLGSTLKSQNPSQESRENVSRNQRSETEAKCAARITIKAEIFNEDVREMPDIKPDLHLLGPVENDNHTMVLDKIKTVTAAIKKEVQEGEIFSQKEVSPKQNIKEIEDGFYLQLDEKFRWWFRTTMSSEYFPLYSGSCIPVSELVKESTEDLVPCTSNLRRSVGGSVGSSLCQVHEISSSTAPITEVPVKDQELLSEFCGRSLLSAKIRNPKTNTIQNIFWLSTDIAYEDEDDFSASCNLCNEPVIGRRELAKHVTSLTHLENLHKFGCAMDDAKSPSSKADTSAPEIRNGKNLGGKEAKVPSQVGSSRDKSISSKTSNDMEIGKTSTGLEIKVPISPGSKRRRSYSRSRSRSPSYNKNRHRRRSRERRRSRSPERIPRSPERFKKSRRSRTPERRYDRVRRSRSRSRDKVRVRRSRSRSRRRRSRSLSRDKKHHSRYKRSKSRSRSRNRSKSPVMPKKDNKEFHEKLALTAEGKWTDFMEKQWKLMEAEEAMFLEEFLTKTNEYKSIPESHPEYPNEWSLFWEKKYQEVERAGKDPDSYDYISDWKEVWHIRLNELLKQEAKENLMRIKKKFKMDYESLSAIRKFGPGCVEESFHSEPKLPPERESHSVVSFNEPLNLPPIQVDANVTKPEPVKKTISIEEFKSTWEALTGSRVGQTPDESGKNSNPVLTDLRNKESLGRQHNCDDWSTTTSSSNLDLEGPNIVQILNLMCQCEDQLSFLAPKAQEYLRLAEELENKRVRGSKELLKNVEAVTLLFQVRDRFMTLIRSNVLGRDILRNLNYTVFGLNNILDSPECQKFRPKPQEVSETTTTPSLPEPLNLEDRNVPALPRETKRNGLNLNDSAKPEVSNNDTNPKHLEAVRDYFSIISPDLKHSIVCELTKYLIFMGHEDLDDKALEKFLCQLIHPLIEPKVPLKKQSPIEHLRGSREVSHSSDVRVTGVSSTFGCSSINLPGVSTVETTSTPHSMQGVRRDNDLKGGRVSPFSCREFSGNPLSQR